MPEEMGTFASKMLAMVKMVSCVKALATDQVVQDATR